MLTFSVKCALRYGFFYGAPADAAKSSSDIEGYHSLELSVRAVKYIEVALLGISCVGWRWRRLRSGQPVNVG